MHIVMLVFVRLNSALHVRKASGLAVYSLPDPINKTTKQYLHAASATSAPFPVKGTK